MSGIDRVPGIRNNGKVGELLVVTRRGSGDEGGDTAALSSAHVLQEFAASLNRNAAEAVAAGSGNGGDPPPSTVGRCYPGESLFSA